MNSTNNLQSILLELSFTPEESAAFLKSIQTMKESQHDVSIDVEERYWALINEVVENEI